MNLPCLELKKSVHNTAEVLQLHFEKNESLLQQLRQFKTLRWSQTMKCWYLPHSPGIRQELFQLLAGKVWLDYKDWNKITEIEKPKELNLLATQSPTPPKVKQQVESLKPLSEDTKLKLEDFKRWMQSKRYGQSTIGTYSDALKTFLRFYADKTIAEINNEDVIEFNNNYILKNKLSSSFQNQVVNAIKLFFSIVENIKIEIELIHRPRREHRLPNVLSKEEVKQILNAHGNLKHKAMLSLIYSCGLRRSELLNLKLENIDSERKLIIIKQSKGKKDRVVPLSEKILEMLRNYYVAYKPKQWLFEGQKGNEQYDENSLRAVMKQALEKCKIDKPVTLHWLRHSYATHLLEAGTDLRYIQEILGHSRSTTTEIYTHVSNKNIQKIISPFDTL